MRLAAAPFSRTCILLNTDPFFSCPVSGKRCKQADPNSVDFRKVESPSRFRRMTLPHSNLAACDLHRLRQSAGSNFKTERSASTSTSGYAGSSDSNHISLVGNTLRASKSQESEADHTIAGDRRRSSSAMGGVKVKDKKGKEKKGLKETTAVSPAVAEEKEEKEEKDRLSKFLARSTRRASRPFRRAKTLLDNHLNS